MYYSKIELLQLNNTWNTTYKTKMRNFISVSVLVIGGLCERLGYNGIKILLQRELLTLRIDKSCNKTLTVANILY